MNCEICGRDLDKIGQDNMADGNEYMVLCEDCYNNKTKVRNDFNINTQEFRVIKVFGRVRKYVTTGLKEFYIDKNQIAFHCMREYGPYQNETEVDTILILEGEKIIKCINCNNFIGEIEYMKEG